jgi:hypothetical protein
MKEVSEVEFFERMKPLNVHPSNQYPDHTRWEMLDGSRRLIGVSKPGWKDGGNPNVCKQWFLVEGDHETA